MATDRLRAALLATVLATASPAALQAQSLTGAGRADMLHAGTLEVPLNKSQVISADRAISKAMIGNDEIADVVPVTDRSLYVLGRKMGTTSLTLYDGGGRVISILDVAVGPDVQGLETQLRQYVPGEAIDAHIANDAVVLSGMVNDPSSVSRAMKIAQAYAGDKVVNLLLIGSSQQVMLEVRFAEVTRSNNKDVGIRTSVSSRNGSSLGVSGDGSTYIPGGTQTSSVGTQNTSNSANSTNSSRTSSLTSNGTANQDVSGTYRKLDGTTGLITGGVSDFNNLDTLNGKVFTGSGAAGASNTVSNTQTGEASSSGSNIVESLIGGLATSALAVTTTTLGDVMQMGPVADGFGIFRQRFNIGGLAINAVLNAMETRGLAKTLARPTLVAISGEKASFLAGGEFPIPVAQSGNSSGLGQQAITVEFKPFGVSLGFTPTVLGDKTISMIVEPEVSAIDPSASIQLGNIVIPGIRTRRASTTVQLRDGESFAIAGLISKDFQTTVRQVPLLGSIPILGALFRSSGFQKGETELMIVVTPHLVAPIKESQVRLPTDTITDPSGARTILLGEPSVRKSTPANPPDAVGSKPAVDVPAAGKESRYEY